MMRYILLAVAFFAVVAASFASAQADNVLLLVEDAPPDGLVVADVDLTSAADWCKVGPVVSEITAVTVDDRKPIPFQFVPGADYHPLKRIAGTVILRLPEPGSARVQLEFGKLDVEASLWDGTVTTPDFVVTHDPKLSGGLPSRIAFPESGKVFESLKWNDRVYHREKGWFGLSADPNPEVKQVSGGSLCTVIRVKARYTSASGGQPDSQPEAVYDWHYFRDRPTVFVKAVARQREPFAWPEHHFLEMNYPQEQFPNWAGGDTLKQGQFTGSKDSLQFSQWGAVLDGQNAVGFFRCGQALLYDGGSGTYLHAHGGAAWGGWDDTQRRYSAWLWIGSRDDPVAAIRAAAENLPTDARVAVTVDEVRARVLAARQDTTGDEGQRGNNWWRAFGADHLEAEGRFKEAVRVASGELPSNWKALTAGRMGMILEKLDSGVRLVNLFDLAAGRPLLVSESLPLFEITLRDTESDDELRLDAASGWERVELVSPGEDEVIIRLSQPKDERLQGLSVEARAETEDDIDALKWKFSVVAPGKRWSVWRAVFPQVAVADLGPEANVFVPRAAGEVQKGLWQRSFRFTGTYPSGWSSMQFAAAYDQQLETGLYVAVHDPLGSTKDIKIESRPADRAVVLSFDHPVPDMGVAGNGFQLSGEAVWKLLRGDWFDAALTYRNWMRKEAKWFPKLAAEGREDTTRWMRELSVWALDSGEPEGCVPRVKQFAQFMGVPVGVHWYNWHQIPFDNDYPHYFPTKEGFAEGVRQLQESDIFVMPYINGRLWDTRDKGMDDFQFSRIALPGATKDENGDPHTEMYGSKESDGSRVKLAAMCPATDVWKDKVREIVLRLFNECGVKGVYIDQVAAARPRLCFDAAHGHPLGGGHWWNEAYWDLIGAIRKEMPDDCMLTTECNAEPYAHRFDGYLTWHWQHDGQVPAFPAIYGGAIQMFGRAYRGGPSKDLALRMKAGEQLVFGEQIGWINPSVLNEKENAEFLRRVVHLRHRLRRYFFAGEMARPPKPIGDVPTVTADWQWSGQWPVTTSALMAGAWCLPNQRRAVLIFVNVGDEPLSARLDVDLADYGMPDSSFRVAKITPTTEESLSITGADLQREHIFPPRTAWAWELTAE